MKKNTLSVPVLASVLALSACSTPAPPPAQTMTKTIPNHLRFDPTNYTTLDVVVGDTAFKVRAFENIVYVANPVDSDYQAMNIYVPEQYFLGGTINGYTADTAPIFMPNAVGGYMPAKPMTVGVGKDNQPNSLGVALSKGYVVASAGARGRTLKDDDGKFYGKAPAGIVDLKAAVRYLKANDKPMAGRADRIIVNGTSAGGAMAVLLGASADHKDYEDELNKIGALAGSDAVFAVSGYAPITNLDKADMAYEWQFNGIDDYKKMSITMLDYHIKRELIDSQLSDKEKALSAQLKSDFPNYINALKLKGYNGQLLSLNADGNGSFKDEVIYYLNKSLNTAHKKGIDLSSYAFVAQSKSIEPYYIANYQDYLINYLGRGKGVPAFDGVALDRGENGLFGNETQDNRHFTPFAYQNSNANNPQLADEITVKQMNPMSYLNDGNAKVAQHWRIRHGAKDNDTSLAVPVILATALQNQGKSVDFALVWEKGHAGDYDLDELFDWADKKVAWAK